jgi:threonine/homoserine/homoserine lactone efflux protein
MSCRRVEMSACCQQRYTVMARTIEADVNFVQATAAASGLSALIVWAQPVFAAIRWAGAAYLAFLGAQAIRSAIRGRYELTGGGQSAVAARRFAGWRQGFLPNITNPKVLVFYLVVLPQFLVPGSSAGWLLALAWTRAALSPAWLLALTAGLHRLRGLLGRPRGPPGTGRHCGRGAPRLQRPPGS